MESLSPQGNKVWVSGSRNKVEGASNVVLEEFAFEIENVDISKIASELIKVLPNGKEYDYWRSTLKESLCILPEDAFRDFTLFATEVQTHIKIEPDKKTVKDGALWTSESLPVDTVMYVPLIANQSREGKKQPAADVLRKVTTQSDTLRINFGGDETTGQGYVAVKFMDGAA